MRIHRFHINIPIIIWLFCALSCHTDHEDIDKSEEDEKIIQPTLPYQSLTIKEVMPSDAQNMTLTQTFDCTEGKLTGYTGKQTYAPFDFELTNHSTILYKDNQAIVTNEDNAISTYTLNTYGYATQCIRQEGGGDERTYTFYYEIGSENKHYLKEINEILPDGQSFSSIKIERDDNHSISSIRRQIETNVQNYRTVGDIGEEKKNLSEIPHPFLVESHPLSMHQEALYGKLLGEPCPMMKKQIKPDNSEENVTYEFSNDKEGWFTSCKITTIRDKEKYTRNITYSFISNE